MKSDSLPAVRIAPELRDGESLSAFVEEAVRLNVLRREADREFVERGLEALARAQQSGKYHSAGKVLRELRADLAAARKRVAAEPG